MSRTLRIRDLTLRDGQQSQFATRMTQAQVERVLPMFARTNFYALEVWGGAVPDSVMRYLGENPWHRLESIKAAIGGASKLTALSRGRNLFGYNPYPNSVIEGFCRNAVQSGIDIMRIFDALNDVDNMTASIRFVKENGGLADCAVCYTTDPVQPRKGLLARFRTPKAIFTPRYFVEKAVALQEAGADLVSIKDMAGLITPQATAELVRALKAELKVPLDLHTHCTPGFGLASVLVAMIEGVDIVDAVILPFAGGPAAPAFELVQVFAQKLGIETGVDLKAVAEIQDHLFEIRAELAAFDEFKDHIPPRFHVGEDALPPEIDAHFDAAIAHAQAGRWTELLTACHAIERHFNFPPPDEPVRKAQIPGGMYTNMLAQMKQAKQEHLFEKVLELVPQVRVDAGCVPLVTPTSQIVGAQAVNCVLAELKGQPRYANASSNFVNLVKGSYGRTPTPIQPDFRQQIAGVREETPYDTTAYAPQPNPALPEFGGLKLAQDEKEQLLLELFPSVADKYLRTVRAAQWAAQPRPEPQPIQDETWDYWERAAQSMGA